MPWRRSPAQLGGRRPVVAVLDTGIGPHPWLDCSTSPAADEFVYLDTVTQALILAGELGEGKTEPLAGPVEAPVYDSALLGELDTHSGHGTFISGIIRQAAPDAKVRSVRIMHDDGVVYENDLLLVLSTLLDDVVEAQNGEAPADTFVDVISLSAGYYSENADDEAYTSQLADLVVALAERGVLFVASAGNDSTDRPCYPAALPPMPGGTPAVWSVGALNPNGSKAFFSNDGAWVRCWATGAAVVSTYPTDYDGSQKPLDSIPEPNAPGLPQRRETIDPDDFSSGFATWSGTSFSAPLVAAALAATMLFEAERDPATMSLTELDPARAAARAARAVRTLGG
jgi:subtilisin family serine protease